MMTSLTPHLVVLAHLLNYVGKLSDAQTSSYALDRQSTCGKTLTVYNSDLILRARSNVAPANPPLECIVYLQSAYEAADGRNRLQIIVEQLQIEDCKVKLALFNGRGASGNYLRLLGCSSSSTDIIYTKDRLATVRFTRPQDLYQTEYALTLAVRAYDDEDSIGTKTGVDTLSVGAIIGIVVGLLVVIAIAILLCWCCCTGRIQDFLQRGHRKEKGPVVVTTTRPGVGYAEGSIDSNLEKLSTTSSTQQLKNGINFEEPAVWASVTGSGLEGSRNFRHGVPRKATARGYTNPQEGISAQMRSGTERGGIQGRRNEDGLQHYGNDGVRDSHAYEPYETDEHMDRSPRFVKRADYPRASSRSRGSRQSRNSATRDEEGEEGGRKETMIDDVGSGSNDDSENNVKAPLDSSETDTTAPDRVGSEADVDMIASPMHVNAAVRASVPDLSEEPAATSLPCEPKKNRSTSPKSRKKPRGGREPDPVGLPPEAFDPVFTTPTSQEQYPGEFQPLQPLGMPFMPYGMFPLVPGQQTYAYAYQTAPQMGSYPGQQGAYFMQSVPTADGDVHKTTFAMQSTRTPGDKSRKGKGMGGGMGHPGSPEFTSTPTTVPEAGKPADPSPHMPLSATGAAPDPGTGHRSMAMKSFADPNTGMQTTQVLWTDNLPDSTDPKPGDSSQVTRKTTTRVTTRSGYGELPPTTTMLLDEPDPNPAFLAPSSNQPAPLPPAAATPNASNVDYYMGQGSAPVPSPDVVHEAPNRSRAIRDRITFGDSSEV